MWTDGDRSICPRYTGTSASEKEKKKSLKKA